MDDQPSVSDLCCLKWSCSKWKQNYAELLGINSLVNVEKKVQILIQMEAPGGHWRRE